MKHHLLYIGGKECTCTLMGPTFFCVGRKQYTPTLINRQERVHPYPKHCLHHMAKSVPTSFSMGRKEYTMYFCTIPCQGE